MTSNSEYKQTFYLIAISRKLSNLGVGARIARPQVGCPGCQIADYRTDRQVMSLLREKQSPFPQLRRVAPMCATGGAELNVLLLSTIGQGNNIGTTGLQCKPLQVGTLICCCFGRLARFLYLSFRAFNTFLPYVISSGRRKPNSRQRIVEKSP